MHLPKQIEVSSKLKDNIGDWESQKVCRLWQKNVTVEKMYKLASLKEHGKMCWPKWLKALKIKNKTKQNQPTAHKHCILIGKVVPMGSHVNDS